METPNSVSQKITWAFIKTLIHGYIIRSKIYLIKMFENQLLTIGQFLTIFLTIGIGIGKYAFISFSLNCNMAQLSPLVAKKH